MEYCMECGQHEMAYTVYDYPNGGVESGMHCRFCGHFEALETYEPKKWRCDRCDPEGLAIPPCVLSMGDTDTHPTPDACPFGHEEAHWREVE